MKKIGIITDSASNIEENIGEGIFVVPLYVNFGEYSKKDLLEISPEELYEKLKDEAPTTSAPSIDDFSKKIREMKELGYEEILGVALSSGVSATYMAMKLAFDESDLPGIAIDSLRGSCAEGYLVRYGKKLIDEGKNLEEIGEILERKKSDTALYAMVSDLKYLIRGGRLKPVKGLIGSVLKINPILHLSKKGKVDSIASVRGKSRALLKLKSLVENDLKGVKEYYFSAIYAQNKEELIELREIFKDIINSATDYNEAAITAVLGAQVGPSLKAVSYMKIS